MAQLLAEGRIEKMKTQLAEPVQYTLPMGEALVAMNPLLGKSIQLSFNGAIHCLACGRKTKKSFNQGYCYPCFQKLACCDSCIVSPEKCHYEAGTCREPEWGDQFCMTEHFVYLANSSGLKVGITRGTQIPTRWMDQGAVQALPIFRVQTRQQSGFVEDALRQHTKDKTDWRAMLKGGQVDVDLLVERDRLLGEIAPELSALGERFGLQAIQPVLDVPPISIRYPVLEYPTKVSSFNLDKEPELSGTLMGIKGQYLILDTGVINLRKYSAYHLALYLN